MKAMKQPWRWSILVGKRRSIHLHKLGAGEDLIEPVHLTPRNSEKRRSAFVCQDYTLICVDDDYTILKAVDERTQKPGVLHRFAFRFSLCRFELSVVTGRLLFFQRKAAIGCHEFRHAHIIGVQIASIADQCRYYVSIALVMSCNGKDRACLKPGQLALGRPCLLVELHYAEGRLF